MLEGWSPMRAKEELTILAKISDEGPSAIMAGLLAVVVPLMRTTKASIQATADVRSSGCTRGQLTRRRQLAADPCLTYSREAGRAAATGFRMMSTFRILRPRLDASAPRFETPRSRWIDFARADSSRSSSLSDRSQPTASSLLASNQPANDSTPNRLLMGLGEKVLLLLHYMEHWPAVPSKAVTRQ